MAASPVPDPAHAPTASAHAAPPAQDAAAARTTGWKHSIPNVLTLLRLALSVVFFALVLSFDARNLSTGDGLGATWTLAAAASVFCVAALTDALDGHLARKWNVVSAFGRVMDPVADKVLVLGGLILLVTPVFAVPVSAGAPELSADALAAHGNGAAMSGKGDGARAWEMLTPLRAWMVLVVLGRELLVTSLRSLLEAQGVAFAAGASGKAKMVLQSVCVPGILVMLAAGGGDKGNWGYVVMEVVVWSMVVVTAGSAVPYVRRARLAFSRGGSAV